MVIKKFNTLCLWTIGAVYFLILLGGTVRSTGAGMGCPDWPKCFNRWIPPTDLDQLPENYKEIYSSYRNEKNAKFAQYLSLLGAQHTAEQLLNDKSILETSNFNATKTWIEYINRLVGAIVGFLILLLALFSFRLRKSHRKFFILALITLLIVILQGWFGSIVISTNLTPWTITVHLFLALLIVALLSVFLAMSSSGIPPQKALVPVSTRWMLAGCMLMLLTQIFLGTTVRGEVDRVALSGVPRDAWVIHLGNSFWIHRLVSVAVLLLHIILLYMLRKTPTGRVLSSVLLMLTAAALISGAGMAYFGIPLFIQPLHLLLAAILFGVQWQLFYKLNLWFKFGVQYNG